MRCTLLCCCLLLALPVSANEIYRWVDDNGVVHFTDRPREGAERLTIRTASPTTGARSATAAAPRGEQRELIAEPDADQTAEVRSANCTSSRERLARLQRAPRLYREGEDGERLYLDDDERTLVLAEAQELVESWCD